MTKRSKLPTVQELFDHAVGIARAFGVSLQEDPTQPNPEYAYCVPEEMIVVASPITDEARYAVVLHELGHLLHPGGFMRLGVDKSRREGLDPLQAALLRLEEEENAWAWAIYASLDWTPTMEHVKILSLQSYQEEVTDARRLMISKVMHPFRPRKSQYDLGGFLGDILKGGKK